MSEIIAAAITAVLALAGVVITNVASNSKARASIDQAISTAQAITDVKLDELTREVRAHNNFAQRIPTLEREMKDIKQDVKRLEGFHLKSTE